MLHWMEIAGKLYPLQEKHNPADIYFPFRARGKPDFLGRFVLPIEAQTALPSQHLTGL